MKVLVACEESQRVCIAFRKLGHESFSCDIEPCSGGHTEWHIQADVLPLLNGNCVFQTVDGSLHNLFGRWDLIIAHPPCTYLSCSGNRSFSFKLNTLDNLINRCQLRCVAYDFFMSCVNADCDMIAIENPQGYMNTHFRRPDQVIHPYYFADSVNDKENYYQKRTCLWLKGLPPLIRKNYLPKPPPGWVEGICNIKGGQRERAKVRSKTFPGIAEAMAAQWGALTF